MDAGPCCSTQGALRASERIALTLQSASLQQTLREPRIPAGCRAATRGERREVETLVLSRAERRASGDAATAIENGREPLEPGNVGSQQRPLVDPEPQREGLLRNTL